MATHPRATVLLVAVVAAVLTTAAAFAAGLTGPQPVSGAKPAIVLKTGNLGKVLVTPSKYGVYYRAVEKKAGGKIRCTGQCAVAWPPVYVRETVQKHVKGRSGSSRSTATGVHVSPRPCGGRAVRQRRRLVRSATRIGRARAQAAATVDHEADIDGLFVSVWWTTQ